MGNKFINLDQLRAESVRVQFLGKKFEIGYIPSGLAIPLIENHNKNVKEQKETDSNEKIINDEIRSIAVFCSFYEKDFTEDYLRLNATEKQIDAMYRLIVEAIFNNFIQEANPNTSESDSSLEKKTIGQN